MGIRNNSVAFHGLETGEGMELQMEALLGIKGFGTTHNKKVQGNNTGTVAKAKPTRYRQYMNRPGGFNRALSPTK